MVFVGLQVECVMVIEKIIGPWYWMIVKTSWSGSALVTNKD